MKVLFIFLFLRKFTTCVISATNPQAVPLLSVNIPIGLRFRDNPGSIASQSTFRDTNNNLLGLQVQPGNSLALVGGNITVSDGGRLTASGGSIELGGLATAGTVGLDISNISASGEDKQGLLSGIFSEVNENAQGDAGGKCW